MTKGNLGLPPQEVARAGTFVRAVVGTPLSSTVSLGKADQERAHADIHNLRGYIFQATHAAERIELLKSAIKGTQQAVN